MLVLSFWVVRQINWPCVKIHRFAKLSQTKPTRTWCLASLKTTFCMRWPKIVESRKHPWSRKWTQLGNPNAVFLTFSKRRSFNLSTRWVQSLTTEPNSFRITRSFWVVLSAPKKSWVWFEIWWLQQTECHLLRQNMGQLFWDICKFSTPSRCLRVIRWAIVRSRKSTLQACWLCHNLETQNHWLVELLGPQNWVSLA